MAISTVGTVTRDILVTTKIAGSGGKSKPTVALVGNGVLVKTVIPLVPAEKTGGTPDPSLLRIYGQQTGFSGNTQPNTTPPDAHTHPFSLPDTPAAATFISNITATPIQNISNFTQALRRFQVDRAGLGSDAIEVSALSSGEVRTRVRVAATIARLELQSTGDKDLLRQDAFTCFTNGNANVTLTLPDASEDVVGLEYYFAVNPALNPGVLTVAVNSRKDVIQIRQSQEFVKKLEKKARVIEETTVDERAESVTGSFSATNADKLMLVIACRAPRLWLAESVGADGDYLQRLPNWTTS